MARNPSESEEPTMRPSAITRTRRLGAIVIAVAMTVGLATSVADAGPRPRPKVERPSAELVETALGRSLVAVDAEAPVSPQRCEELERRTWLAPIWVAPGVHRVNCAIPSGAKLLVNLGGTLCFEDEVDDIADLRRYCRGLEREIPGMHTLIVNGRDVREPANVMSGPFTVDFPADHPFEIGPGPVEMVYFGRSVVLSGLPDGVHRIRVLFRAAPNDQDVEFDVDVRYRVVVGER